MSADIFLQVGTIGLIVGAGVFGFCCFAFGSWWIKDFLKGVVLGALLMCAGYLLYMLFSEG